MDCNKQIVFTKGGGLAAAFYDRKKIMYGTGILIAGERGIYDRNDKK